jgi:hypothetical protein
MTGNGKGKGGKIRYHDYYVYGKYHKYTNFLFRSETGVLYMYLLENNVKRGGKKRRGWFKMSDVT